MMTLEIAQDPVPIDFKSLVCITEPKYPIESKNSSITSTLSISTSDEYPDYSSQNSSSNDFWETQEVIAASCLSLHITEASEGTHEATETIRHQLRLRREQLSPEKILAALSWASISRTGSHEAGFGLYLSKSNQAFPFSILGSPDTTVLELLHSITATLQSAILNQSSYLSESVKRSPDETKSPQLRFVVDLTDLLTYSSPYSENGVIKSHCDDEPHIVLRTCFEDNTTALEAKFDPNHIAKARAKRLLWQLDEIMFQFESNATNAQLKTISTLSRQDLLQIREWNPKLPSDDLPHVHEQIEAWARDKHPADAIDAWDGLLSFREVHEFSSRLAHYLRDVCSLLPGDIVPFCIDRSAMSVLCMLAIMKSGAAFVPLNPSDPRERHEGIVETCGAKMVLVVDNDNTFEGKAVMVSWGLIDTLPSSQGKSLPKIESDALAYVLFTSGSTGRPKGVMVEQKSLSYGALVHTGKEYAQDHSCRVLQFASLTFDACLSENLSPLANGCCICIPDAKTRFEGLADYINAKRINWAFFTPSFFKLLNPDDVPGLRYVVVGGEAITPDCIEKWAHRIRLVNGYGPAENTIVSTARVVDPDVKAKNRSSIGKGMICNTWVVDAEDHTRLLPIGYIGELALQSPKVARGYLHDEEKTKAAFVDTPEWGRMEGCTDYDRMYKTGDLVKYMDDGSLLFCGRKDSQVKVRGQRLELAEVEWHIPADMIQYSAVLVPKAGAYKGSLLVVMADTDWESHISGVSGFHILQGEGRRKALVVAEKAREKLSTKLPSFAVPDIWLPILKMPLNNSDKIDRKSLSQWIESLQSRESGLHSHHGEIGIPLERTRATNETESLIQEAWAHVLGIDRSRTPIDSSFQSLGGDSIRAITVLRRCRSENIQLDISSILKGNTIRELASKCGHNISGSSVAEKLDLPFTLSPIQGLYARHMPSESHYFNQSCLVCWNKQQSSTDVENAVREVVKTHSMLRTRMMKTQAGPGHQLITREPESSFTFRLRSAASIEDVHLIIRNSQADINIEQGPVLVADMIEIPDGFPLLSLVVSHFSIDIVSWEIILEDIENYLRTGQALALPSVSFQTWCLQQQYDAQNVWAQQDILPCSLPSMEIEFWEVPPIKNVHRNKTTTKFRVGVDATSHLVNNCSSSSISVLDVFLASLFLGFVRSFPDRQAPVIWNEGHGREPWRADLDISRTVGWFTSLTPIILQTAARDDVWHIAQSLRHFRNQLLHGGMPFFASRFYNGMDSGGHDDMEIVFNYMGHRQDIADSDAWFHVLPEFRGESGDDASGNMPRFSIFEISAEICDDEIDFTFTWPTGIKHEDRIGTWVEATRSILETVPDVSSASRSIHHGLPSCDVTQLRLDYDTSMVVIDNAREKVRVCDSSIIKILPTTSTQLAMVTSQDEGLPFFRAQLLYSVRASTGPMVTSNLISAWKQVVSQHEILRTAFIRRPGHALMFDQVVLDQYEPRIEVVTDREPPVDHPLQFPDLDWDEHEVRHRFTIFEGIEAKVLFEGSHALLDHVSLQTIFKHLSDAYGDEILPQDIAPFSNLTEITSLQSREGSFTFWRKLLGTTSKGHLCHSDVQAEAWKDFRRKRIPFSEDSSRELLSLSQSTSFTPALIFRFAYAVLIARRLRNPNIGFDYTVAGRDVDVPGIEKIVGPCLNLIGCALEMDEQSTARQCLEELGTQFLESLPHQHAYMDFAAIHGDHKGLQRARISCFDTMLNFRPHTDGPRQRDQALQIEVIGERDPFNVS